jgi:hypothetical protein
MSAVLLRVARRVLEAPLPAMSAGILLARDNGHADVADELMRVKSEWVRTSAKLLERLEGV